MEQGEIEDFLKNWQKILENWREVSKQVGAISNSIAKNTEGVIKGVELRFEPIRMFAFENERIFEGVMDSMRSISDNIREGLKNFSVPETMTADIGRIAEGLTEQMKPLGKMLKKWQTLAESW